MNSNLLVRWSICSGLQWSIYTGLHWSAYTGAGWSTSPALAVSYGFYFSVNFAMTLSENGKKIIERVPPENLLIETDGPFVKINDERATPIDVSLIYKRILNTKKDSEQSPILETFLDENFRKLIL